MNIAPKANWFSIDTSGSYRGNVVLANAKAGNPSGSNNAHHTVTHQEQVDYWPTWAAFSDMMVPHTSDDPSEKNNFLGNFYLGRL